MKKAQLCFLHSLCFIYERIGINNMIVNFTETEIEHTLYLFPFAVIKLNEFGRNSNDNKKNNMKFNHYMFIVNISKLWMSQCTNDEKEIIRMRFFERKRYDYISTQLGYKNHSSVIRKSKEIIKKLSYIDFHDQLDDTLV